jgi:eukaryotic-like serine/threonine-protein kinase
MRVDGPSRFEVLEPVGSGGTAAVYRARDTESGGQVALKIMRGLSELDARRLEREASALASVAHDGIVGYVAHGRDQAGALWLAMEWIDGPPLSRVLRRQRLAIEEVARLGHAIALALAAAHARGLVHRDLKPQNVILAGGSVERPKLVDFGLAKAWNSPAATVLTQTGMIIGTPAYMAPEQARGSSQLDARVDGFALGCVLHECLAGKAPFVAAHVWATLAKVLFDDPIDVRDARPDTPAELAELIGALLSKDPARRPDAAAAAAVLGDLTTSRPSDGPQRRRFAPSSPEKRLVSVVVVGAAADGPETIPDGAPTRSMRSDRTVGSDTLVRVLAVTSRYGAHVEQLAARHVVVVLRGEGAASDLAANAARCALAIRERIEDEPIVLATGAAMVAGRLPVGEIIDTAARLLAQPGAADEHGAVPVRLDQLTAGLLDPRFEVAQTGAVIELWGERASQVAARTLMGRPAPFAGRDRELLMLEAVLAEVEVESVARVVLITGDAGVGKSRLRHELVSRLAQRGQLGRVWIGRGDPMSAGSPFGIVAQALRSALGLVEGVALETLRDQLHERLAELIEPGELRRVRDFLGELLAVPFSSDGHAALASARRDPVLMGDHVRHAFGDFLGASAQRGPVVLVLEDLQWSDLSSINLIESAALALPDLPVTVIALARPTVTTLFPQLWEKLGCVRLPLPPLTRRACERIVRAVLPSIEPEVLATILDRAGGNAFLLEELTRCVAEGQTDLPATALAVAQARLDALDAVGRRVIRAATIFGNAFWRSGIVELLAPDTPEVEVYRQLVSLADRELITTRTSSRIAGEREYVFRHVLLREAAYAALSDDDRRLGHRIAADWLASHGETDPMMLAEHYDRGGIGEHAARCYHRAAVEALAGNDYAAVHARVARACGLTEDPALQGTLLALDAEAHRWNAQFAQAADVARRALEHFPPGSAEWFEIGGEAGHAAALAEDFAFAEEVARKLVEQTPTPPALTAWTIACAKLAARLLLAERTHAADRLLAALAAAPPAEPGIASAWLSRAHSLRASGDDRILTPALMGASAAAFAAAGDERNAAVQWLNQVEGLCELGAFDEALAALEAVEARAARLPGHFRFHALDARALIAIYSDRPELCPPTPPATLARAPETRNSGLLFLDLAEVRRRAGQLDEARALVARAMAALEAYPATAAGASAVSARIALDEGRRADALAAAERAAASLSRDAIDTRVMLIRLAHVLALEGNGRIADAAEAAREARALIDAQTATIPADRRAAFRDGISLHRELLAAHARLTAG